MMVGSLRRFFIRRFRHIVYEMVKSVEKEKQARELEQILGTLKFRGSGIRVNGVLQIRNPHHVSIGNNVHIGDNAFFHGYGGLTIGDNAHISRNVTIYTYNHDYKGEVLPYGKKMIGKSVNIGKNVWIGMNVTIVPGVTIGEGAIIGMGSVVSQDIPPMAIIGSQPVRHIKFREKEHYHQLERELRYGGVGGEPLSDKEIKKFK